jgi:hypothetical protein
MSDRNENVAKAARRALIESEPDKSQAYGLAVEYYEDSAGYLAGTNFLFLS